jgi:hypothetical protein
MSSTGRSYEMTSSPNELMPLIGPKYAPYTEDGNPGSDGARFSDNDGTEEQGRVSYCKGKVKDHEEAVKDSSEDIGRVQGSCNIVEESPYEVKSKAQRFGDKDTQECH